MSANADTENIMALKALCGKNGKINAAESRGKLSDIISAAVPYMPPDKRRAAFYIAKLMEISQFGTGNITALETPVQDKRTRREEFLKSVSPYLSDSEKSGIETLIKVIELKKIMG